MIKRWSALAVAFLLMTSLSSCSFFDTDNRFVGGELLDDDMMSEIKEEIFGSEIESSSDSDIEESSVNDDEDYETLDSEENNESYDGLVYWTKSGSVWHTYEDCGSLKNSNNVFSGSVDEAIESGKNKLCSRCEDRDKS